MTCKSLPKIRWYELKVYCQGDDEGEVPQESALLRPERLYLDCWFLGKVYTCLWQWNNPQKGADVGSTSICLGETRKLANHSHVCGIPSTAFFRFTTWRESKVQKTISLLHRRGALHIKEIWDWPSRYQNQRRDAPFCPANSYDFPRICWWLSWKFFKVADVYDESVLNDVFLEGFDARFRHSLC